MSNLDAILPGLPQPEELDLAVAVPSDAPAAALAGLADWIGRLALGAATLTRLPASGDGPAGLPPPALRLELAHVADTAGADLGCVADGHFVLRYGDPAALLALTRGLGHPGAAWRPGTRQIAWRDGTVYADGTPTATLPPTADGPASGGLLALLPGQGHDGPPPPAALPAGATRDWVLAAVDFAARWSVSATCALPWPFLRPAAAGPAVPTVHLLSDGLLHVPADAGPWRALAHLPTYPERPLRFRQHRVPAPEASLPVLHQSETAVPWEGDRLAELVAGEVARSLPGSGAAAVEVFASEPAAVRAELAERLRSLLGASLPVHVRSASKQAYHHAVEVLLPRLRAFAGRIGSLEIEVPRAEPGEDRIERPSAWVAALAPADEVLAGALGLPLAAVTLTAGSRFAFTARDAAGAALHAETFTPLTREVDLDPVYPGRQATVETGGARVLAADGRVLGEWRCETDMEAAHAAFRTALRELVTRFGGEGAALPLFASLRVAATLSEADEDLPAPWERFSPLEELHEEIYFGALAALDGICRRVGDGRLRAPGLIVPEVAQGLRAPTRVTVLVRGPEGPLAPPPEAETLQAAALGFDGPSLVLQAAAPAPAGTRLFPSLLPPGVSVALPGGEHLAAPSPAAPAAPPTQPYGPEDAEAVCAGTAAATGALWWVEEESYGGRPVPVLLWWRAPAAAAVSPPKLAARRPSLLVVGGHHANEVAACVSAVQFVHELARRELRTLVVVVPLENADGAALDRALRQAHPAWKLHAARFNGLGHEFGGDGPDTPFGEARVRRRLLADFAADALLDDHGVPAHEWAQPFAGRSSPPLFPMAYTYPSGLLYGIGQDRPEVAALWERVTAALDGDPSLAGAHRRLWDRYARYGVALFPDEFPSRPRAGWPFQVMRRARDVEGPLRFITEVGDEGAVGEQLRACIAAHLAADLAFAEGLSGRKE